MLGLPLTNYHVWQLKKYSRHILLVSFLVILIGNILCAIFFKQIEVDPKSYISKEGYPFFVSGKDYIDLIKQYPYSFGTKIKIHKVENGESYWDIAFRNHISIDTLIAANPFLDSLIAKDGIEIAVPQENGVLFAVDNWLDAFRMSYKLDFAGLIKGSYIQSVFRILSLDKVRFAFYKDVRPAIVNDSLEKLYALRRIFQSPLRGRFTSMYGNRIDPFSSEEIEFHEGIDIKGSYGEEILPARDGCVSYVGWYYDMGMCIRVQHRDGYETTYGHCSAIKVKKGDFVTKDSVIGLVGSTGRSTGSHLHFTLRRHGQLINPLIFIW